ncbi:TIGR02594 family protein [Mesorhizobium sp. BR1-1-16]|uniref:NlpC/P60 family protein n=1 Tax=Mesorhizobium sp. BR1-1-16 TaxID=2876653 RepID=UPI001CCB7A35|nr:TIGR02594 family protein [Mesorhizobium sp. BR1-1-16]MBZ9937664.1 TIGR02594 family protein [Mesorhizobium sp. BR1-1-16]
MKIIDIQVALASLGFRPGPLDDIWGRQTAAAVRAFQAKNGLDPDGVIGPMTLAALMPNVARSLDLSDPTLVWFKEACRLKGVTEVAGPKSNPVIDGWAKGLGITYGGDDIPWCGLFVGHCISATLDREPTPTGLLSARSWQQFGVATSPTPGAVMVFWRKSKQSGLGHVGFYAGEDDGAYRILGGNQSNRVSLAWVDRDRLVAARWPSTVPPPVPHSVEIKNRSENLSWNEA